MGERKGVRVGHLWGEGTESVGNAAPSCESDMWSTRRNSCAGGDRRRRGIHRRRNRRGRGRVYRRRGPGSLCGRGRSRRGDDGESGECGIGGRRQGETTQGLAVLWAKRGHVWLLKLELKLKCDDRKWKSENRKWARGRCRRYELKYKSPGETGAQY